MEPAWVTPLVILAHRLGLGWLAGRKYLVVTTAASGSDDRTHTVMPYRYVDGELRVRPEPGAQWMEELGPRRVAMVQAAPGPLSVQAVDRGDELAFQSTGQPTHYPLDSDLIWVLPTIVFAWLCARAVRN